MNTEGRQQRLQPNIVPTEALTDQCLPPCSSCSYLSIPQSPMDALRASPKKGSNALKRLGINVSEVRCACLLVEDVHCAYLAGRLLVAPASAPTRWLPSGNCSARHQPLSLANACASCCSFHVPGQ